MELTVSAASASVIIVNVLFIIYSCLFNSTANYFFCHFINNIKVMAQTHENKYRRKHYGLRTLQTINPTLFRYLAITSQSDPKVKTLPSTPGQHDMARELAKELKTLGLDDIVIDEFATVTAVKR